LAFCLSGMVSETGIQFRKKGGSAAAVRLCADSGRMNIPGRKFMLCILALLIAAAAVFSLCRSSGEADSLIRADSASDGEIVMPLD
ncbi:MAG: hypothetical protein ABFR50_09870, partial [Candidatus Fermentibacteria bacterium]